MRLVLSLVVVTAGFVVPPVPAHAQPEECSTVVTTSLGTVDGRPILWKNRDTENLNNRVIFVQETPYSYLALIDDDDTSGRVAWSGLNSAGFAVCNSVAYNLPERSGDLKDLEGQIMADALRTCATIDDFERYLQGRLGKALGAQTNFCVIDARGGAAILETHNRGFQRWNAASSPGGYLVNTNYARSGTTGKGSGYMRFQRESLLLDQAPGKRLSVPYLFQNVTRDLGHLLLRHPSREEWKLLDEGTPFWVYTNHCINRGSTAAAVMVQGVRRGEDPMTATLWVALGEPVTTIAVPLWVGAGPTPGPVHHGLITTEALRLKGKARPGKHSEEGEYLDLTKLDNRAGSGWLPKLLEEERKVMEETRVFEAGKPDVPLRAAFQSKIAARVWEVLRALP